MTSGFDICERIARAKNASLYRAARELSPERFRFFLAAYASMRLIDDLVDDTFLALPTAEARAEARPKAAGRLQAWMGQVAAARDGLAGPDGPLPDAVVGALRETLGRSDLDIAPWRALKAALARDIAEIDLESWDDFLGYCDGATAAPASIFIYVLACRLDRTGGYVGPLSHPPLYYARDMAIFCYLVHILRDLAEDAAAADQLLTIPFDILEEAGLSRDSLRAAVLERKFMKLEPLSAILLERAWSHFEIGQQRSAKLLAVLDAEAGIQLGRLFAVYIDLARTMATDYAGFLSDAAAKREAATARHLGH